MYIPLLFVSNRAVTRSFVYFLFYFWRPWSGTRFACLVHSISSLVHWFEKIGRSREKKKDQGVDKSNWYLYLSCDVNEMFEVCIELHYSYGTSTIVISVCDVVIISSLSRWCFRWSNRMGRGKSDKVTLSNASPQPIINHTAISVVTFLLSTTISSKDSLRIDSQV